MVQTFWLIALVAALAAPARLLSVDELRRRYGFLASWLVAEAAVAIALAISGGAIQSEQYQAWWSCTEWALMALRALAVGELMLSLIRQYGSHNRRFLRSFSAILTLTMLGVSVASICVMECRLIRWNEPLLVQFTVAGSRALCAAIALTLLASWLLMLRWPLPRFNRNCAIQRTILLIWFGLTAIELYALFALAPIHYATPLVSWGPIRFTELQAFGFFESLRDIALLGWLALAMRPEMEVDFVPPPFPVGYHRMRRWALVMLTHERRNRWEGAKRRAKRWLSGSRTRLA